MYHDKYETTKRENVKMKNVYFFYFQYKGMKMKALNKNLIYRSYCKKKETSQEGYQEANT
jgi:hypothetical protein